MMSVSDSPISLSSHELSVIRQILKDQVPEYDVWAFGSRVNGTARQFSDLDLAIITKKPLSLALRADLDEAFSEADLPFKVDVLDWASTSEAFRRIITAQRNELQVGTPLSAHKP